MNIPARILRASAADIIPARPSLTLREREQRVIILSAGRTLMAEFGSHAMSMANFAASIRISTATIRRHFADLDNLLGTILRDHLMEVVTALGAVPRSAPNRARACRAAYLQATRTSLGAPSAAHLLLIRDRHTLPLDELASVEAIRNTIGETMAGVHAELTLALLDTPQIHPSRMEAALAAILAAPISLEAPPAQPVPGRVAPFTPRLRPLQPNPARAGTPEIPNTAFWERATPPPGAVQGLHGNELTEVLRRASS